jgi:hypothetical protein
MCPPSIIWYSVYHALVRVYARVYLYLYACVVVGEVLLQDVGPLTVIVPHLHLIPRELRVKLHPGVVVRVL